MATPVRKEHDAYGTVELPAECLYGLNTARAVEYFDFSGRTLGDEPGLVAGFAAVKQAAAAANRRTGCLDAERADAIVRACDDMRSGRLSDWLVVDLLEGAGGTSLNMNVNEVLANAAIVRLGGNPGDYARVHPNDHVNRSQSTNDVVPSAISLGCHTAAGDLIGVLDELAGALTARQAEFSAILRLGRTCFQDAQPMTVGQAFGAYAAGAARARDRLAAARSDLLVLPLGATAIGTGYGAPPGYREAVFDALRGTTGLDVVPAEDLFDALSNADGFVRFSGELAAAASVLGKIATDLITLSSGPAGGVGELRLPQLQAGSSIMPGKVNPVVPMALRQIAHAVAGANATVIAAATDGLHEINHNEPLIAYELLSSLRLLQRGTALLARQCIRGITVDEERTRLNLRSSPAIGTTLAGERGYGRATELVQRAAAENRPLADLLIEAGEYTEAELDALIRDAVAGGADEAE